jgi:hypothetical protein
MVLNAPNRAQISRPVQPTFKSSINTLMHQCHSSSRASAIFLLVPWNIGISPTSIGPVSDRRTASL